MDEAKTGTCWLEIKCPKCGKIDRFFVGSVTSITREVEVNSLIISG
jgi:phage FluMu protein Com